MRAFSLSVILATSLCFYSCIEGSSSSDPDKTKNTKNDFIELSGNSVQSDLGQSTTSQISITSVDLDGTVDLEIDRTFLDTQFQADDDIEIELEQNQVTLSKGQTQQVNINFVVKTSAPSFTNGKVKVTATLPNDETLDLEIAFRVYAKYEIRLNTNVEGDHTWDRPAVENFRTHQGDLEISFINMDHLAAHRIHAAGPIPHQNDNMAAAPSAGSEGGKYEVIVNQEGGNTVNYYCHNHEVSADSQQFNFNVNP